MKNTALNSVSGGLIMQNQKLRDLILPNWSSRDLISKNCKVRGLIYAYCLYIYIAYVWCHLQKISFFDTNCQKCRFKFVLFCMQDRSRLRIRIRDHPLTRFDTTNPMVAQELKNELPLKIKIFLGKPDLSRFAWNFNKLISGALFLETEHTSGLVLMSGI